MKIDRENASRFAVIQAYVSGRDLVGFVKEAQANVARDVPLPQGYRLVWGGQFENQKRAAARLGVVVPASLALIFLVLFVTLRSIRQALLILANIPFAMIGGVLALWASGEYLSVPASVGFIALMGIAANFIANLLNRHRWIAYVGLAIILYVALDMIYRGALEVMPYLPVG